MPGAHREDDKRFCGAKTIVEGQSTVKVNNKLWAVEDDPNSHKDGKLKAIYGAQNVYINNKKVICAVGDDAGADKRNHPGPPTAPAQASGDVYVYEGGDGSSA